jgi:hypothetical protein
VISMVLRIVRYRESSAATERERKRFVLPLAKRDTTIFELNAYGGVPRYNDPFFQENVLLSFWSQVLLAPLC